MIFSRRRRDAGESVYRQLPAVGRAGMLLQAGMWHPGHCPFHQGLGGGCKRPLECWGSHRTEVTPVALLLGNKDVGTGLTDWFDLEGTLKLPVEGLGWPGLGRSSWTSGGSIYHSGVICKDFVWAFQLGEELGTRRIPSREQGEGEDEQKGG